MEKKQCFGQTRTTGRIWSLLLVLLLWHSGASAEDYYWRVNFGNTVIKSHPSPTDSCKAVVASSTSLVFERITRVNETTYYCDYRYTSSGDPWRGGVTMRYGTSCPLNTQYNTETGECTAPPTDPCLPTTGEKIGHRHKLGEIALGTIATSPPPPTICHNSCRYSDPELDGKPYRFVSNSPTGAWATFSYFGDGDSCEAGEVEADTPSDNKPVSDKENKCSNKVCLTVDESGNCQQYTYSCTATETYTDPGKMDCDFGDFNGEAVCVPNSPAPKMTEKEVTTDVEETINSDGSKDTKTTTTTNTTTCSGVGSCSTSTTTNVSNNKTNADGSDGGSSSSCTGADCTASDGKSQADEEEEQESESNVSGGTQCDAPPVCTGDAIQCAILRQSYTQRCNDEKFQEVDGEKLTQEVAAGFEGAEFKPFSEAESSVFDMNNVLDTSSTIGGSSCPALPSLTFSMNGQSQTFSFADYMAELCKYAGWFGYLLVAFTGRRSIEIIVGGLK